MNIMKSQAENAEFYQSVMENRLAMYSKPRRYYNREGSNGSSFRFLFLIEIIAFLLLAGMATSAFGQEATNSPMVQAGAFNPQSSNIYNYTATYNSGKVFVNWTAKEEPADCIYIVERSADGRKFESVGVKEGIGTPLELFYSWMDHTPPAGFAYYRVKKITKEGTQFYSSTNTIINQSSSFDPASNYARGGENADGQK